MILSQKELTNFVCFNCKNWNNLSLAFNILWHSIDDWHKKEKGKVYRQDMWGQKFIFFGEPQTCAASCWHLLQWSFPFVRFRNGAHYVEILTPERMKISKAKNFLNVLAVQFTEACQQDSVRHHKVEFGIIVHFR